MESLEELEEKYGELYKVISRGSYGKVYKTSDNQYIVKKIKTDNNNLRDDMLTELGVLTIMKNSQFNIHMYDYYIDKKNSYIYLVLERGKESLDSMMMGKRNITIKYLKHIYLSMIIGVMELHNKNILHGDIKLSNMIILPNGKLKLIDYGISVINNCPINKANYLKYTEPYRPPEIRDSHNIIIDFSSDIWALGVAMLSFYLGRHILGPPEVIYTKIHDNIDKVDDVNLKNLLLNMLDIDPKKRPTIYDVYNSDYFNISEKAPNINCISKNYNILPTLIIPNIENKKIDYDYFMSEVNEINTYDIVNNKHTYYTVAIESAYYMANYLYKYFNYDLKKVDKIIKDSLHLYYILYMDEELYNVDIIYILHACNGNFIFSVPSLFNSIIENNELIEQFNNAEFMNKSLKQIVDQVYDI